MAQKNSDDVLQRYRDELWSDIDPSRHFPAVTPLLAHYTSLFTLEAIIKGQELWMSHPFLMNDLEELRWGIIHGTERFVQSADITAAVGSDEDFQVVVKALMDARNLDGEVYSYDTYIACFSEHVQGDSDGRLSMWRAYGSDGGGAAIVFDTSKLTEDENSPLLIAPVDYRTTAQRLEWIDSAIGKAAKAIRELGADASEQALQEVARNYYVRIRRAALFSKHASFEEEREWRVVYLPDLDPSERFRELMGYAITPKGIQPKLKLRLGEKSIGRPLHLEDVIETILLGPTAGSLIAHHATIRLCEAAGQPALASRVKSSGTPYRP
ncbi:DUF2971 domain-containing protein [Stenotrophomonas rhizophila]